MLDISMHIAHGQRQTLYQHQGMSFQEAGTGAEATSFLIGHCRK